MPGAAGASPYDEDATAGEGVVGFGAAAPGDGVGASAPTEGSSEIVGAVGVHNLALGHGRWGRAEPLAVRILGGYLWRRDDGIEALGAARHPVASALLLRLEATLGVDAFGFFCNAYSLVNQWPSSSSWAFFLFFFASGWPASQMHKSENKNKE